MLSMLRLTVLLLLLPAGLPAQAAPLDIKITQGMEEALPIAVVPFGWNGPAESLPLDMHVTIANDLSRSGRFRPMAVADMPQKPVTFQDIKFSDWRLLGMENIVVGSLRPLQNGDFDIEFRLIDVYKGTQIAGFRIPSSAAPYRPPHQRYHL